MTITHHPGDELLLAYAHGASSEPVALLVATHLSVCEICRRDVRGMEATGGAMLSAVEPEVMNARALEAVLSRLDERAPASQAQPMPRGDVPSSLQPYVGTDFAKAHWVSVAPGISQLPLIARNGVRARLIRAKPGTGVSVHTHRGEEWTMVLTGSYHDETGRYLPGDVQTTTPDVSHRPVADEGPFCINLAVTDAPLVFKGFLPSVIGRIFGF
jgi:putative transcriptional regulator